MKGIVYFLVKDIEKSIEFYTQLLEMPPINTEVHDGKLRWADWGDKSCIALIRADAIVDKVTYGNNAVFNYRVDDLEEEYRKVKKLGAKIIVETMLVHENPYRYECFMIEDLDGNLIEIAMYGK